MNEKEFIKQIELNKGIILHACRTYCESLSRNDLMQEIIAETWRSLDR